MSRDLGGDFCKNCRGDLSPSGVRTGLVGVNGSSLCARCLEVERALDLAHALVEAHAKVWPGR